MKHSVSLHEDGYIYFKKDGDFLLEDAKVLLERQIELCNKVRASGKPVLILAEILANGGFEPSARSLFIDNTNRLDFDKIAVYSRNTIIKTLINFFLMVAGDKILKNGREVRFFTSKQAAIKWLKN